MKCMIFPISRALLTRPSSEYKSYLTALHWTSHPFRMPQPLRSPEALPKKASQTFGALRSQWSLAFINPTHEPTLPFCRVQNSHEGIRNDDRSTFTYLLEVTQQSRNFGWTPAWPNALFTPIYTQAIQDRASCWVTTSNYSMTWPGKLWIYHTWRRKDWLKKGASSVSFNLLLKKKTSCENQHNPGIMQKEEGGEGQRGEGLQHFLAAGRILQATVATLKEVRSRQRDQGNLLRARFPTVAEASTGQSLQAGTLLLKKLLTEHALGTEHEHSGANWTHSNWGETDWEKPKCNFQSWHHIQWDYKKVNSDHKGSQSSSCFLQYPHYCRLLPPFGMPTLMQQ